MTTLYALATVSGKFELYLDADCTMHEGGILPDFFELMSFCYVRRLAIVPIGLGRCRLERYIVAPQQVVNVLLDPTYKPPVKE